MRQSGCPSRWAEDSQAGPVYLGAGAPFLTEPPFWGGLKGRNQMNTHHLCHRGKKRRTKRKDSPRKTEVYNPERPSGPKAEACFLKCQEPVTCLFALKCNQAETTASPTPRCWIQMMEMPEMLGLPVCGGASFDLWHGQLRKAF